MSEQLLPYETPDPRAVRPAALRAVAWIFIAFGILAVVGIVVDLVRGRVNLNFAVIGIFIGRGLLQRSPAWRTCAIVCCWIGTIGLLLIAALIGLEGGRPALVAIGMYVGFLALNVWIHMVLVRSDVKAQFVRHADPSEVASAAVGLRAMTARRVQRVEDVDEQP